MHVLVSQLLQSAAQSAVEATVTQAFQVIFRPRTAAPPATCPTEEATAVMHDFLCAVAARDMDAFVGLCDAVWGIQPETAALMDDTFAAAPPVSWAFRELVAPEGWREGLPLPWLVADLAVTFEGGGRYETIPAVLRTVRNPEGWQVDHLAWGRYPEPVPVGECLADLGFVFPQIDFSEDRPQAVAEPRPAHEVIDCARCGLRMRVPTDKGRLRVTCRKCTNAQWYTPPA